MKQLKILLPALFVILFIFTACEKDEDRAYFSENVVPPEIGNIPDLNLLAENATDTLIFTADSVNPGYTASADYSVQACLAGNGFEDFVEIASNIRADTIKASVEDINDELLDLFTAGVQSDADIRIRAVLEVDAGRGAPGSGANPIDYFSESISVKVTPYEPVE